MAVNVGKFLEFHVIHVPQILGNKSDGNQSDLNLQLTLEDNETFSFGVNVSHQMQIQDKEKQM